MQLPKSGYNFLMAFLATAAVVVPVWLYWVDLQSKSFSGRVVSQTELQPASTNNLSGLKMSFDGVLLTRPILTTVELTNDGGRPIAKSDFESSVELRVQPGTKLVSAQVVSTSPPDLEAKVVVDSQLIRIEPLLLNAKDTLTISILSSGEKPTFSTRARIAGVAKIDFGEVDEKKTNQTSRILLLLLALFLTIASALTSDSVFSNTGVNLRRRAAILTSAVTAIAGSMLVLHVVESTGKATWNFFFTYLMLWIGASIFAAVLNIKSSKQA